MDSALIKKLSNPDESFLIAKLLLTLTQLTRRGRRTEFPYILICTVTVIGGGYRRSGWRSKRVAACVTFWGTIIWTTHCLKFMLNHKCWCKVSHNNRIVRIVAKEEKTRAMMTEDDDGFCRVVVVYYANELGVWGPPSKHQQLQQYNLKDHARRRVLLSTN